MHGGPDHCRPPVVWRRFVKERRPPSERNRGQTNPVCAREPSSARLTAARTPDGRAGCGSRVLRLIRPTTLIVRDDLTRHKGAARTMRMRWNDSPRDGALAPGVDVSPERRGGGQPTADVAPGNPETTKAASGCPGRPSHAKFAQGNRLAKALHLEPAIAGANVHRTEITPAPLARWERMNARGAGCF
jgi:hypothetical protein